VIQDTRRQIGMPQPSELIAEGVRAERAGALERALELFQAAAEQSADPGVRSAALTHVADVMRERCDWDDAIASANEARRLAESIPSDGLAYEARIAEANVLMCRGDFEGAEPRFVSIAASVADPRLRGIALQNLGSMYAQRGNQAAAQCAFSESLASFEEAKYARGEAIALNNLGRFALDSGQCGIARGILDRALVLAREVEDAELAALASVNLAWAHCELGEVDRSQDLAMAALGYFSECHNRWREIECFRLIGIINEKCEDFANAKRCYELALNLAEQIGSAREIETTRMRLHGLPVAAAGVRSA
jgi:tetratricopeptide (TPR) repeat protein